MTQACTSPYKGLYCTSIYQCSKSQLIITWTSILDQQHNYDTVKILPHQVTFLYIRTVNVPCQPYICEVEIQPYKHMTTSLQYAYKI